MTVRWPAGMRQSQGPQPARALPLVLQTYTAVYYVLADLMMLTLYFHYKFKKRPSPRECQEVRWQPRGPGRGEEAGFPRRW